MPPCSDPDLLPNNPAARLESILGGTLALLTHYGAQAQPGRVGPHRLQPGADRAAPQGLDRAALDVHGPVHRLARPAGSAGCAVGQRVARRLADAAPGAVGHCGALG